MTESRQGGSDPSENGQLRVNTKNPFTMPEERKARKLWQKILAGVVVVIVAIAAIIAFQSLQKGGYIAGYSAELTLDGRTANVTYSVNLVNGRSDDQRWSYIASAILEIAHSGETGQINMPSSRYQQGRPLRLT